ncbi:MAG: hypothetical protein M3Z28_06510 [Candidatus Dormibacteraeota bacterium]|nr:hypothetical protein [Candidatus Dormibacteraeota bacterium]
MRWRPILVAGAALGAALWLTGWVLSHFVDLATNRGLLGLTEGQARALLNPGILLLLPVAWVFRKAQAGRDGNLGTAGLWLQTIGLILLLIGNFLEYGWWDNRITAFGYAVMAVGVLPLTVGWFLSGISALRVGALPSWLAALPLAISTLLPLSLLTGLTSAELATRQPAFERLLMGMGLGWLALSVGVFLVTSRKPLMLAE